MRRGTRATAGQNYNGAAERVAGARTALTNTYGDWSSVSGSTYRITSGGTTTRCPSLVKECPGAQRNDRFNDVGWAGLANGTLGVTWSYQTARCVLAQDDKNGIAALY
jgi:hypothetical protein